MRCAAIFLLCLSLIGCALSPADLPQASVASPALTGTAYGGQQPIRGATVSVYEAGTAGYGLGAVFKASTITGADGSFGFSSGAYTCSYANAPMYLTVIGGSSGGANNANLALIAGLGPCTAARSESINVDEVTTAATVFALAQFMNPTLGAGVTPTIGGPAPGGGVYNRGLVAAMDNTLPALINAASGTALGNATSGAVTITREAAKLNSIANTLAACVNTAGQTSGSDVTSACGRLFKYSNANNAVVRPYDTVQAGLMMALYPYSSVSDLFYLATAESPFTGLGSTPNDWTLATSYALPSMGVGINGSATSRTSMSLDIDSTGRIWFPSTTSGATGIGVFDPATSTFAGPYGGASLTHPQYVAVDSNGVAWATDLAANRTVGVSTTSPSTTPTVLSLSGASTMGPLAIEGSNVFAAYNASSTGYLDEASASVTGSSIAEQGGLDLAALTATGAAAQNLTRAYAVSGSSTPCYLFNAQVPNVPAVTSGTSCYTGGMASNQLVLTGLGGLLMTAVMTTSNNQICDDQTVACNTPAVGLNAPEGIATDGYNNLWIANSGNASVSTLGGYNLSFAQNATVPYIHDSTHGGTLTTPYAIGIDGSGNVWTISPGCVTTSATACTPTGMVLTEIIGAAGPTVTPLQTAAATGSVGIRPTY
jgi:hypothetical protein